MSDRLPDWETRLAEYLAGWTDAEFAYGERDCGLFASGAVEAMTEVDPAAAFRGTYATKAEAAAALREHGDGTLLRTVKAMFEPVPIGFAQRGDLVWHGGAVGICDGGNALFVGTENGVTGLVRVPRAEWVSAFRVGR